jgi:hypothetical protein
MHMEVSSGFGETGYELKAGQKAVAGGWHSERHPKDWQAEESITVKDVFQAAVFLHTSHFSIVWVQYET